MQRRGFPFTSKERAFLKAFPVTSATDFCSLLHSSDRGPTAWAEAAGDVSAIETQPIRNPVRAFITTTLLVIWAVGEPEQSSIDAALWRSRRTERAASPRL